MSLEMDAKKTLLHGHGKEFISIPASFSAFGLLYLNTIKKIKCVQRDIMLMTIYDLNPPSFQRVGVVHVMTVLVFHAQASSHISFHLI